MSDNRHETVLQATLAGVRDRLSKRAKLSLADDERFDAHFPDSPLARCRRLMDDLGRRVRFLPAVARLPAYQGGPRHRGRAGWPQARRKRRSSPCWRPPEPIPATNPRSVFWARSCCSWATAASGRWSS